MEYCAALTIAFLACLSLVLAERLHVAHKRIRNQMANFDRVDSERLKWRSKYQSARASLWQVKKITRDWIDD